MTTWQHLNKYKHTINGCPGAEPYARIGSENLCIHCGDAIEPVVVDTTEPVSGYAQCFVCETDVPQTVSKYRIGSIVIDLCPKCAYLEEVK